MIRTINVALHITGVVATQKSGLGSN